jgi:hypothetical protein
MNDQFNKDNVFEGGSRVECHPACDAWMQGDRYGEVIAQVEGEESMVCVKMDSGRILNFPPDLVRKV